MESLLLPEAAHPRRDAPSLPSSCTFYTSPTGRRCGCSTPVQGGSAGADRELALLCPWSHRAFQPPSGWLEVAAGWVSKVSTCWITTWKNPTRAGGKQRAGDAVAASRISAGSRTWLVRENHAPGFSIRPMSTSPPRRAPKGATGWVSRPTILWLLGEPNQHLIAGSRLPNLLQCRTGSTGVSPTAPLCHPTLSLHQLG